MYTLYYIIHLEGKDVEFTMNGRDIKRLFLAYDLLKHDHPNDYIRVIQITKDGLEFWK